MLKGRVNTLMAGVQSAGRGRYSAAGYAYDEEQTQERELYIAADEAGFAREMLRDNNRIGYSAEELDEDGLPFSFFMEEKQRGKKREEERRVKKVKYQASRKQEAELDEMTFVERFERAFRKERHTAILCGVLLALNLTLLAFFGQAVIDGVRVRDQILMYERGAATYQAEIDAVTMKIEEATNGTLIRNKAQNELGMLRSERVATQKIYIQAPSVSAQTPVQQVAQEESGLLDWLLSVADIFDFKS